MDLNTLRQQRPELATLDDATIVKSIALQYGVPEDTVAQRLGVPVAPPPAPKRTFLGTAADLGISALQGAIAVPESAVGVADMVSGGRAGQAIEGLGVRFKDANNFLNEQLSPAQQQANQNVQSADGIVDTAKAAIQNPSTIVHSIVQSLPSMAAGGLVGRGLMGIGARVMGAEAAAAGSMGPYAVPGTLARAVGSESAGEIAGAVGEGVQMAGQDTEQFRQENPDGLLKDGQAAIGLGIGAEGAGFALVGAKVAHMLGLNNVHTMIAAGRANPVAAKGLTRRLLEGAVSEGLLEEMPQSIGEQVLQNMATDKPLDEGVDNQAVMGFFAGAAMGAGANAMGHNFAKPQAKPAIPAVGVLSAAVQSVPATGNPIPDASPEALHENVQTLVDDEAKNRAAPAGVDRGLTPAEPSAPLMPEGQQLVSDRDAELYRDATGGIADPFADVPVAGQKPAQVADNAGSASAPTIEPGTVDEGAHEAHSSPLNDKTATKEQILDDSAELGHTIFRGRDVSIENTDGSERVDLKNEPPKWRTPMRGVHYGRFLGTKGMDGDHVDVFLKAGTAKDYDGPIYVVDQVHQDGSNTVDEHKVMAGFRNRGAAINAYKAHYSPDWKMGRVTEMSSAQFDDWIKNGDHTKPASPAGPMAPKKSATGFTEAFDSLKGGGTTEHLYAGLFAALQQGKDTHAGVKDPVLAKAKLAFDAGHIKSPADLRTFVQSGYDWRSINGEKPTGAPNVTENPAQASLVGSEPAARADAANAAPGGELRGSVAVADEAAGALGAAAGGAVAEDHAQPAGERVGATDATITEPQGAAPDAGAARAADVPAAGAAPTVQAAGRTVRVADEDVTLTPEQSRRWDAADDDAEEQRATARATFERTKNQPRGNDPDVGLKSPKERLDADLKRIGMELSARRRRIAERLTAKEQAADAVDAAKLKAGTRVQVPVDGTPQGATVLGTPFGKVKVRLDSGEELTVPRAGVEKEEKKTLQQRRAEGKAKKVAESAQPSENPAAPNTTTGATASAESGQEAKPGAGNPETSPEPTGDLTVASGLPTTASAAANTLGRVMHSAGWEVEFIDLDLTSDRPKASIRLNRGDGRFLVAKVDSLGRATMETFQREKSLGRPSNFKGRHPLQPMVDDVFLGRKRFEGARSMLRSMVAYLADNSLHPVSLSDMRNAWAGVMAAPTQAQSLNAPVQTSHEHSDTSSAPSSQVETLSPAPEAVHQDPAAPHLQSEAEFGAAEQARVVEHLERELAQAKKGELATGKFQRYASKAAAVRELTAELEKTRAARPESFASDHLAAINRAREGGEDTTPENLKRYVLKPLDQVTANTPAAAAPTEPAAPEAAESANDRDTFTLERLNRDTNAMESVAFARGEYVRASFVSGKGEDFGEIDGISHARREFSVDGRWHPFGAAYKAERPAEPKRDTVPLSSVIDKANAKHGAGLTEADRVPDTRSLMDRHVETMNDVRAGRGNIEDFKASFHAVADGREAVLAELNAKKKDDLLRAGGGHFAYRHKADKKADVVSALYERVLAEYALGKNYGPNSYYMTNDGLAKHQQAKREALAELVSNQTQDDLDKFAAEVAAAREESGARRAALKESIEDPKTLEQLRDFIRFHKEQGKTFEEARMLLTPEQRASFDTLTAQETRAARASSKDARRAVSAAGQTVDGGIIETTHTKKGHALFVVQLSERVSREDYTTLNAGAKKLGGYYSSYRGSGAVPGFQFTDRPAAEAFVALAGGNTEQAQGVANERRDAFEDDKSQSAAQRLRTMAERLKDQAQESLSRERKANTERRARFAAAAEAEANGQQALADTMERIASALESGQAALLDRVRQKTQVEFLERAVRTAKDEELRAKYPAYADFERHRGAAPTGETADFAAFPAYTAYRSDLASMARQLEDVDGMKLLGQRLMKMADDVSDAYTAFAKANVLEVAKFFSRNNGLATFESKAQAERSLKGSGLTGKAVVLAVKRGEYRIVLSPSEAIRRGIWQGDGDKRITLPPELGAELVEKASRRKALREAVLPWQLETAHERRKALARMGIETPAEFRAALREYIGLREAPKEADRVKTLERAMVGRKNDGLDFFPTPEGTADEMVDAAGIEPGMRVLEPSAGWGHIAERIREAGVEPDVIELSEDRRALLEAKGFNLVGRDFMDLAEGGYDRIVMNPPFSDGRDIAHVQHAYSLLKPGGRVVAIMGESAFSNSQKRAQEFRDWLDEHGGTEEKLAEGTFADPSLPVMTGANARMVVVEKPADAPSFKQDSSLAGPVTPAKLVSLQQFADDFTEKWAKAPPVVVVASVAHQDTPPAVRAEARKVIAAGGNTPSAVLYGGKAYLFADKIHSNEQAAEAIAHEIKGHFGLRGNFGPELDGILKQIAQARPAQVAQMIRKNGFNADERMRAAEEILAEMAQKQPTLGFVRRAVAAIRTFLRGLGVNLKLTDDEIVRNWLAPAAQYVESGKRENQSSYAPGAQFSSGASPFYSALSRGLAALSDKSLTHTGWEGAINALVNKGKAKADEVEWSGVKEWLQTQQGRVPKEDVLTFLANNGVQVQEVHKGGSNATKDVDRLRVELDALGYHISDGNSPLLTRRRDGAVFSLDDGAWNYDGHESDLTDDPLDHHAEALATKFAKAYGDTIDEEGTRYSEYTLPGGQNYREVLLTLPSDVKPEDRGTAYARETSTDYRSSHWSEPNILAHIRLNDRTDADGKRVLFVEELQSDWAQAGRKQGFRDAARAAELRAQADALKSKLNVTTEEGRAAFAERQRLRMEADRLEDAPTPVAPFVGKTDAWLTLALKRIVKMAADEGYDRVAFVNGEQSAERYSLAKQIGRVEWSQRPTSEKGANATPPTEGTLQAWNPAGDSVITERMPAEKIGEYVGEEVAKKLLAAPVRSHNGYGHEVRRLDGLDLKVGGEGMKAFYDKIVPAAANKLLPKLGGGKVGETEIAGVPGRINDKENPDYKPLMQPGFDVTPAMRESAKDGLPMFAQDGRGLRTVQVDGVRRPDSNSMGQPIVPAAEGMQGLKNFYRWFGGSKVVDENGRPLVVFHGTGDSFDQFSMAGRQYKNGMRTAGAAWFTPNPKDASWSAQQLPYMRGEVAPAPNVMPVYLSLKNPLVIRSSSGVESDKWFENGHAYPTTADIERLRDAGYDGVIVSDGSAAEASEILAFAPEQIKSSIGNNGQFSPDDGSILFSQYQGTNDPRQFLQVGLDAVHEFANTPGKLNWWHKTMGTMNNLAERSPAFKKVFDGLQTYIADISHYATEAADLAPRILPKLDSWRDMLPQALGGKAPLSVVDKKAIQAPIWEGQVLYTRDQDGRPITVSQAEARYADMDAHDKSQMLLSRGVITEGDLKRWRNLPIASYEGAVNNRFEREYLKAGIKWKDDELKSLYGLTPDQISLHHEAHDAINRSMTKFGLSMMVNMGGKDLKPIADTLMEMTDLKEASDTAREYLTSLAEADPERSAALMDAAGKIHDIATSAQRMMDKGYAPLMRFGHYTVDVVQNPGQENEDRKYFGMYESRMAARAAAEQMAQLFPEAQVFRGTTSDEAYRAFAGTSLETMELLAEMKGLDDGGSSEGDKAFAEYLRLTKSNRSALKRLIERKGIAGYHEDITRVLAGFVTSNSRQISGNLHTKDVMAAQEDIRQNHKQDGELYDAAAKMTRYVFDPQQEAPGVKNLLFAQYLGGSIASALVNMTQPIQVTMPYLSQYGGIKAAARALKTGLAQGWKSSTGDAELDAALKRASEDGVVAPQEIHQLMSYGRGVGSLSGGDGTRLGDLRAMGANAASRAKHGWGQFFATAELFNRRVTYVAAWKLAHEQGIKDADGFARKAVEQTQFIYTKANRPNWARGALGGTLFTFKQYGVSYTELLHRMWTQGGPEGKKAALFGLAMIVLMAGAGGLPFMEDATDILEGIGQRFGYNLSLKAEREKLLKAVFGDVLGGFAENGISAALPLDVSGRMGMQNLIPGTGLFKMKADHTSDVLELAGPAGDLGKRVFQAAGQVTAGQPVDAAMTMMPQSIRNLDKARDMLQTGMYRDQNGKRVIDTDAVDAIIKGVGFQPGDVSDVQQSMRTIQDRVAVAKLVQTEIATEWARRVFEKDPTATQWAQEQVKSWNEKNEDSPIRLRSQDMLKRVRDMNKTKAERLIAGTPAGMRAEVRRQLADPS